MGATSVFVFCVDDFDTKRADLDAWLASDATGIGITNYEKFDQKHTDDESGSNDDVTNLKYGTGDVWPVSGVILDESSMLKSFGTRKFSVLRAFDGVRYKLACSATPAAVRWSASARSGAPTPASPTVTELQDSSRAR
mgnify:CR=1 FL=1